MQLDTFWTVNGNQPYGAKVKQSLDSDFRFRCNAEDKEILQRLSGIMQCSQSEVIREALRCLRDREAQKLFQGFKL